MLTSKLINNVLSSQDAESKMFWNTDTVGLYSYKASVLAQ